MNHREFIESIRENDGRKWDIIEGPDGAGQYWEIPEGEPQLIGKEGPVARRNRKARAQMKKKVARPGKAYTWRLGYNHCIGQFTNDEYPILSGSSLNRKKKPKKPAEKKEVANAIHVFSKRSRGKVKDKATAFHRSTKKNNIFLTLTFIQDLPDSLGVKILNKFLTVLRKQFSDLEYLWVAEHQEENNDRLHFHIILNKWLPIKRYNALWTLQQYNAGLVGKSESGQIYSKEEIKRRYARDMVSRKKKKDGGIMEILNPADICQCHSIDGLAYYLTKYITKQKERDEFGCLNWHCSRGVSRLFTKEVVGPSTFAFLMSFNNVRVNTKTGELFYPRKIQEQFFTMVYVENKPIVLPRLAMLEITNRWLMEKKFEPDEIPIVTNKDYAKLMYHGF